MRTQLFQRLQRAQAHSWPLLHPCPYVPPDQHVDADPCPPTRRCSSVHHRNLPRRAGRRASSDSRHDAGHGSSTRRLEKAENSKKAFIKKWVRSVRAATEGASTEGVWDEAQGGNGTGKGRWDSREDENLYLARPRASITGTTAKSRLRIKNRNWSGYSAADETMFLVSFLVLLQPHAHSQLDLNTSSGTCSETGNARESSVDVIMISGESDVQEAGEMVMNDIKMEEPGGWEDVVVQQKEIHVGAMEPIEIDLDTSSGSCSGTDNAPRSSMDVIMSGPDAQEGRGGAMNDVKMEEPEGWEEEMDEIEPPRVLPLQKHPGTIEGTGSATRRRAFVHERLRSTGMKILRALNFFSWA